MKFLLQLLKDLWASVSHPAQVWAGLKIVLGALWRAFLRVFSPKAPAGQEDDCCLHLDQVYKRADPLIYSQNYLMAKGLSVTWDNPDIQLYEPGPGARGLGAPVDSSALQPDHLYCVRVQVWNGSYSAPAVGMPVTVTFLDFGVGATSHSVGVDVVDLGVKGSSDCPAYAVVDWRTPATAGHYCLQARLEWGDDANPSNNLGQENTNVVTAQSPAHTAFALVNRAATERLFVFEVDAYRLPTLEPCRDTPRRDVSRLEESQARWEAALAKQGLGRFPVPDGWTVELPSDGLVIAPDRETRVEVAIEPPPGTPPNAGEHQRLRTPTRRQRPRPRRRRHALRGENAMSASAPSYTTCFDYHPPDKPFSKSTDMPALFLNHGAAGAVFGIIAGLAAGLVIGGPIGAVAGALVGAFVGGYVAVATAIKEGAQQWLHHRLVCLTGDVCAVGQIKSRPEVSDLGEFDNDEWFNLALMPFPHDPAYEILADATKPETMAAQAALSAHPGNRPLDDRFQGKKLLAPRPDLLTDLGYCKGGDEEGAHDPNQISRNWLHVEAEGDFWVRMDDLAAALGLLAGVEAAGVVGAAIAGGVEGCAIGGFLGIIGCVIGAIIGAIVAAALAAAAAAAVTKAVLQGVFDTEKGNVEDANVDDTPLGELIPGDMVAVYGRHVYDGFHAGWHEMHPLLKICRIPPNTDKEGKDHPLYLRWAPDFFDADTPPTFALPGEQIPDLESGDMRNGLDSDRFLAWCEAIRRHWCRHLGVSEEPHVKRDQLRPEHRWTIHPLVDGCLPTLDPGDPHLPDPGPH